MASKSLMSRSWFTFWVDADAMNNWFYHDHHAWPAPHRSDHLYLPDAKGDFQSHSADYLRVTRFLFELIYVPRCALDYSSISTRASAVKVAYRQSLKGRLPTWLSTQLAWRYLLKASGRLENTASRSDASGVSCSPLTHDIVTAEMSLENLHDAEVLSTLLNSLPCKNDRLWKKGASKIWSCTGDVKGRVG